MSLALLMFNLDESESILRNVQALRSAVDEIVVVDSSSPEEWDRLIRLTKAYGVKVHRVLPLGFVDPLRPFGVSKVQSDRVLMIDADEEVSDPLKSDLRNLTNYDAYVLPRFEARLRSFTNHMRFFRCSAVCYRGRSFDFPLVTGRVGWLGRSHRIIHHANYQSYLDDKSRAERYFTIENVERPFDTRYLREGMTVRFRDRALSLATPRGVGESTLSPPMIRWTVELEFLRDLILGKGLKAAAFGRRYSLAKARFLRALPESDRNELLAIARELSRAGGLFEYLRLDDPNYLEKLTASFRWNLQGIEVYRRLLNYRFRFGEPADSVPAELN